MKQISIFLMMAFGLAMSGFCSTNDDSYMKAYAQFIREDETLSSSEAYDNYTLAYIDGDDIPEMILVDHGDIEAVCVLSLHKGVVSAMHIDRLYLSFIEKSGLFTNRAHCNQGYCTEEVYKLNEDGFEMVAAWRSVDMSMAGDFFGDDEEDGDETELDDMIEYYFNDQKVDEATAEQLLNDAFYAKGEVVMIEELDWFDKEELLKGKY